MKVERCTTYWFSPQVSLFQCCIQLPALSICPRVSQLWQRKPPLRIKGTVTQTEIRFSFTMPALTQSLVFEINWKTLQKSLYSPDLSPYDLFLFGPLKETLGGHQFQRDNKVEKFEHILKCFMKKGSTVLSVRTTSRTSGRLHRKVINLFYIFIQY